MIDEVADEGMNTEEKDGKYIEVRKDSISRDIRMLSSRVNTRRMTNKVNIASSF